MGAANNMTGFISFKTMQTRFVGHVMAILFALILTSLAEARAQGPQRIYMMFFDRESDRISERNRAIIGEAASDARAVPWAHACVSGHADRSVSMERAIELSASRARAVRDLLVQGGVAPDDITTTWSGSTNPLVPTADGIAEPQNRRVEIHRCAVPPDPVKEQEIDEAVLGPLLADSQALVSAGSGCPSEPMSRWEVVFVCPSAAGTGSLTLAVQRWPGGLTADILLRWNSDGAASGRAPAEAALRALIAPIHLTEPDAFVTSFFAPPTMRGQIHTTIRGQVIVSTDVSGDAAASRRVLTVTRLRQ